MEEQQLILTVSLKSQAAIREIKRIERALRVLLQAGLIEAETVSKIADKVPEHIMPFMKVTVTSGSSGESHSHPLKSGRTSGPSSNAPAAGNPDKSQSPHGKSVEEKH